MTCGLEHRFDRAFPPDKWSVPSECFPPPPCADGADNEGDGRTDYPDDPECASSDGDEGQPPACNDAVDNDGDGLIDDDDAGCLTAQDDNEQQAGLACDDGADNDGAGGTDWPTDAGCTSSTDASEHGDACPDDAFEENDLGPDQNLGTISQNEAHRAVGRGTAATQGFRCPDDADAFDFESGGDAAPTTYTVTFDFDPADADLVAHVYDKNTFCFPGAGCGVASLVLVATITAPTGGSPVTFTEGQSGQPDTIDPLVRVAGEIDEKAPYTVRVTHN